MIDVWQAVWKYLFFTSITAFGLMSFWVVIGGGFDILRMLKDLRPDNQDKQS